jgi:putative oxidoreductase
MNTFLRFLRLDFLPASADAGLLILRLWLGLSLGLLHGWSKFTGFSKMSGKFADPLGIGSQASLGLAVFGELVCAALIVFGLFTRSAALAAAITMGVAFFVVHNMALSGPGNGELAFIYLAGFVTLFLTGAGKFSLDAAMGGRSRKN